MKKLKMLLVLPVFLIATGFSEKDSNEFSKDTIYQTLFDMREYLMMDIDDANTIVCKDKLESYLYLVDYCINLYNINTIYQPEYNHAVSIDICTIVTDSTCKNVNAIWYKGQCFTRDLEAENNL